VGGELLHVDEDHRKRQSRLDRLRRKISALARKADIPRCSRTDVFVQEYGSASRVQTLKPGNVIYLGVNNNPLFSKRQGRSFTLESLQPTRSSGLLCYETP
jgi:hypothetical protein